MIGTDRIVFITFVPGSFGSFLLKCLSYSPNVFLQHKNDIYFDKLGATHHNITHFLNNFHNGKWLDKWSRSDEVTKIKQLNESWNPPQEFIDSKLFYLHRLLVPNRIGLIKKYLPKAKYIKITISDKYIPFVMEMIMQKNQVMNLSPNFVQEIRNNDILNDVYNFDVSHFIEGTFLQEFDKLGEWLNFEKVDISKQYENFKQANGLNNDKLV